MKGMASMMKQARDMQKNMEKLQQQLAEVEMEGSAAGGMVTITMTGKNEVRGVKIDPSLLDDVEGLEDIMVVAYNDAHNRVQTYVNAEVSKVTGGMNVPGLT